MFSFCLGQKLASQVVAPLIHISVFFTQFGLFRVGVPPQLAVEVDLTKYDEEEHEAGQATVDCQVLDVVGHVKLSPERHHCSEGHIR